MRMRVLFIAVVIVLGGALRALAGAVTIILAGQSNASGAGTVLPQDRLPDALPVVVVTPEAGIRDTQEPWRTKGTSAGRSFARYLLANDPGITQVWMVACSQGSTRISQWLPNAADGYMNRCLRLAQRAESFGAPVGGVLWMQGENDSGSIEMADAYRARLTTVVNGFRTAIGRDVPFIAAELPNNVPAGRMPYRAIVVQNTREALEALPATGFVGTSDLHAMLAAEPIHWERGPLRAIGNRMGAAFVALRAASATEEVR
jgi:hypothetical protein